MSKIKKGETVVGNRRGFRYGNVNPRWLPTNSKKERENGRERNATTPLPGDAWTHLSSG